MKKAILILAAVFSLVPVLSAQPPYWGLPGYGVPVPANFREDIRVLYRKTTREEQENIRPSAADEQKYAEFLRQPGTGLTRLIPDQGCADNSKIVVATPECLKYTMPGAGSAYSFRINDYRTERLADLTFFKNSFQATGVLLHGILTKIGDVPLENISLQTKGIGFLTGFMPVTEFSQALGIDAQLRNGIVKDGFVYRRALNALEDTTYVLRSVAYEGVVQRTVNGFTYNELSFDRRKDVIVAFRLIRKDPDGSVTILWKKLAEKSAPKIKQKRKPAKA